MLQNSKFSMAGGISSFFLHIDILILVDLIRVFYIDKSNTNKIKKKEATIQILIELTL